MKKYYLYGLSGVALCTAFGVWVAHSYEYVEEQVWVDAKREVSQRPLLAAGLFLQQGDSELRSFSSQSAMRRIPDTVQTMIVCVLLRCSSSASTRPQPSGRSGSISAKSTEPAAMHSLASASVSN